MKKNILKMPDFYVQIAITVVGILALTLGSDLMTTIHSGYDPIDGFFASIAAVIQHVFPNSGWSYTSGVNVGFLISIFMGLIFVVDLLILWKMNKLKHWSGYVQLLFTLAYAYGSGKLVGFWFNTLKNMGFNGYIDKLWDNNNYTMIVLFSAVAVLVLAFGVASFIRGFLFQSPYNGFTIWGCTSFKLEYKYMRIACDFASGVISIILFLIVLNSSDYKSIFGLATFAPLYFGYLVEWIMKAYDITVGKFAKIRL